MEHIAGSIARGQFSAGEPIREEKLIKANGSGYLAAVLPAGMRAISTPISPETGAGGFILPNDRVDVVLIRAQKTTAGEVYSSDTILSNVRVLAIDQTVEEKNGQRVVVGKIATLALSARNAETLVLSTRLGTLALACCVVSPTPSRPTRRRRTALVCVARRRERRALRPVGLRFQVGPNWYLSAGNVDGDRRIVAGESNSVNLP